MANLLRWRSHRQGATDRAHDKIAIRHISGRGCGWNPNADSEEVSRVRRCNPGPPKRSEYDLIRRKLNGPVEEEQRRAMTGPAMAERR
ncbi:hypothetical protein NDU88_008635 [Pleurodeles waltl]|uniref:Uncharacterized protein n=1 Tax=Pleurodeles waltl TaxID=8319 RepID=A0AAV7QV33_PLEWA|nr:hypothetical protein NDU88_008635 [Pleurodeles waltl]